MKRVIDLSNSYINIVYPNSKDDEIYKESGDKKNYKLLSYLSLYYNNSDIFVMGAVDELSTYYLSYNNTNMIYSVSIFKKYEDVKKNIIYIDEDNYKELEFDKKLLRSSIIFLHLDDNLSNFDVCLIYNYLKNAKYKGLIIIDERDLYKINNGNNNDYENMIAIDGFVIINHYSNDVLIKNENNISNTLQIIEEINNINCSNKKHNINVYFSYYKDKNKERQIEIDKCLELNIKNPSINRVIIINESDEEIKNKEIKDKVTVIKSDHRYKFIDFFKTSNVLSSDNDLNILINSDIIIGKGFETLELDNNNFICLSRHDIDKNGNISIDVGGGSHDCWVWKGLIKEDIGGDFYMGKFLCDGVLANDVYNKGYLLKNPVYGLMIYHYHISNIRNYSWNDLIKGQRRGVTFSYNDNVYNQSDIYNDGYNG